MKKFDFFKQFPTPVIVIKDYDNVVFKTSTTATIDDLFNWNKSTGQITAKTDNIPIVPGTVYFTADGHIVHDLA